MMVVQAMHPFALNGATWPLFCTQLSHTTTTDFRNLCPQTQALLPLVKGCHVFAISLCPVWQGFEDQMFGRRPTKAAYGRNIAVASCVVQLKLKPLPLSVSAQYQDQDH